MLSPMVYRLRRSLRTTTLAWYIARHYLFSRERQALEWIVTLISIAGVAVGVGTIISVFGVIDGMQEHIISGITSVGPNLTVNHRDWRQGEPTTATLNCIRALPGVTLAEPSLWQDGVMLLDKGNQVYLRIYATDGLRSLNMNNIKLPKGVTLLKPEPGKLIVCAGLSTATLAGRTGTVISNAMIKTALYPIPKRRTMQIQATFEAGNRRYGDHLAFASWREVRELALKDKGIGPVEVKLADPMAALEVKDKLLKCLPKGTTVNTWIEDFEEMFTDLKIIKAGMVLVMLMTMVVAALNIIGTLTLIVIQKTREIGILKAMGAPRQLVGRIFLAEGALVGVIGSAVGIAMGFGFCWVIKAWKIPMPGNLFRFREIPAQFSLGVALLTALASILICTVAALAPAWRAGGLNPVEALRHE